MAGFGLSDPIELTPFNPSSAAEAVYNCLQLLLSAGHSVTSSGDGTTYSSSGNVITSVAALNNVGAWFRLALADGQREYTVQHVAAGDSWRVKYAYDLGFVGGSPSATQTPSATYEGVLRGGGTDAAPTGQTWLDGNGSTTRVIGRADRAAPYGFYFLGAAGTVDAAWVLDPLLNPHPADPDPYAHWCHDASDIFVYTVLNVGTSCYQMWHGDPTSGGVFQITRYLELVTRSSTQRVVPRGADKNSFDNATDLIPGVYGRWDGQTAPNGIKGLSSLMLWIADGGIGAISTRETLDYDGDSDVFLCAGDVAFAWNGTIEAGNYGEAAIHILLSQTAPVTPADPPPPVLSTLQPSAGDGAIGFRLRS